MEDMMIIALCADKGTVVKIHHFHFDLSKKKKNKLKKGQGKGEFKRSINSMLLKCEKKV